MRARWGVFVPLLLILAGGSAWLRLARDRAPLPPDLTGTLVYVSDRDGVDSLYVRRLPHGEERRLAALGEPARDPALSPDRSQVAFSLGGRIGVVSVATGQVRILTLGVDWRDSAPSWRPDGGALVVVARRAEGDNGDIHLLALDADGAVARHPLTQTPGLDEVAPVFSPDGDFVVFGREDSLFRLDLGDGHTRRLTSGFRRARHPRFLPSGRLLYLWSEGKRYGLDVVDANGKNRETLWAGGVYYRTAVPSPDGRYLAATFTFDLSFHPSQALKLWQTEEVRLLDARGNAVAVLERSWRHSSHSPDWR